MDGRKEGRMIVLSVVVVVVVVVVVAQLHTRSTTAISLDPPPVTPRHPRRPYHLATQGRLGYEGAAAPAAADDDGTGGKVYAEYFQLWQALLDRKNYARCDLHPHLLEGLLAEVYDAIVSNLLT